MDDERQPSGQRSGALSIGELAARTGLTPAVLRTWESRYGFPTPARSAGGHRTYGEADAEMVRRVVVRQRGGVRLEAAIREVTAAAAPTPSVFGTLRRAHPELTPLVLRKPTLLALSRAIEDDYLASADVGTLAGAFQREQFYRASRARWAELARRSRWAVAFADFTGLGGARDQDEDGPALVPLAADAPMRREWSLVAETPRMGVCLAAWETPDSAGLPEPERRFETMWTVDPRATRTALRVCVEVAGACGLASASGLAADLDRTPAAPAPDLAAATALFTRTLSYADRAHPLPS